MNDGEKDVYISIYHILSTNKFITARQMLLCKNYYFIDVRTVFYFENSKRKRLTSMNLFIKPVFVIFLAIKMEKIKWCK